MEPMLCFLSPPKPPFPSHAFGSLLLHFQSKHTFSSFSSSVPSNEHIARLILDQKSPSHAFQTFQWASKIPNFSHNQTTYRALIHKLMLFHQYKSVQQVLREIPTSIGSPPAESIFLTIIRNLGRSRMAKEAIQVLDLISQFDINPSLKIFNSVLDVLVKVDIDLAKRFFRNRMMGCSGVGADDYTFGILMKGLCLTNRISDGFKLLSVMKSNGFVPNTVIYNTLIHALCKNGKLGVGRGRSLMNEMVNPNDVTFNILISGYCREGNLVQAMVLFEQCLSLGFVPDVVTVTKIVEIFCSEGRVMEGFDLLKRIEERGGVVDTVAYNALIKGFCDSGKAAVGGRILKEMASKGCLPNLSTYNTLIAGLCNTGKLELAMDLFHEMRIDGVFPDFSTYDTLIRGLCVEGKIEDGIKILNLMEESSKGPEGKIGAYNSIIYGFYKKNRMEEAYEFLKQIGCFFPRAVDRSLTILHLCKEGKIAEAKGVYDQMVGEGGVPCVLIYVSLIDGFCREGKLCEAFELMNKMVVDKFFPNVSIFDSLIGGFCRNGKVGSALKLMGEMVRRGCQPDVGSYNPLIDVFCRNRDFKKAFEFLIQMVEKGITPDQFTWNSLLLCLSQDPIRVENTSKTRVDFILNQICVH